MNQKPVIVTFKLFAGRDDDLIEWLRSLGSREKSSYIRLAIRQQFIARKNSAPHDFSIGQSFQAGPPVAAVQDCVENNPNPAVSDELLEARLARW
jgi:Tfp pilus assembly protein PilP